MLKKIEAIIREDKVNDVRDALNEIGIVGMNMFEVRGHGRQGGIQLVGRAGTYQVNMLPKIQDQYRFEQTQPGRCYRSDSQVGLYGRDRATALSLLRLWRMSFASARESGARKP